MFGTTGGRQADHYIPEPSFGGLIKTKTKKKTKPTIEKKLGIKQSPNDSLPGSKTNKENLKVALQQN